MPSRRLMSLSTPRNPSSSPASLSIGTQLVSSVDLVAVLVAVAVLELRAALRSRTRRSKTGASASASSSTMRSNGVRPMISSGV